MADQGPLVRVFRGDGTGFKVTRKEADAFVAGNPGAVIEGDPRVVAEGVIEEEAPGNSTPDLSGMTVAELKAHAHERGIDLGGASHKADIVAAIEAANAE